MPVVVNPQSLLNAAHVFAEAGDECDAIVERINDVVKGLESEWDGAARQSFYRNYEEWKPYMENMAGMLRAIAHEMHMLGERVAREDNAL